MLVGACACTMSAMCMQNMCSCIEMLAWQACVKPKTCVTNNKRNTQVHTHYTHNNTLGVFLSLSLTNFVNIRHLLCRWLCDTPHSHIYTHAHKHKHKQTFVAFLAVLQPLVLKRYCAKHITYTWKTYCTRQCFWRQAWWPWNLRCDAAGFWWTLTSASSAWRLALAPPGSSAYASRLAPFALRM